MVLCEYYFPMKMKNKNTDKAPAGFRDGQEKVFDEFLNDIENDMKMEKYQEIWKKHGKWITILASIIIGGTVFFGLWQKYDLNQREEISSQLFQAQNLKEQGRLEESLAIMKFLGEKHQKSYSILARFSQAALLAEQDFSKNAEEIQKIYQNILKSSIPIYFKELAVVLYVNAVLQKLGDNPIDDNLKTELLALLHQYRKSKKGFVLMAQELEGLILFKTGDFKKSRKIFDKISKNKQMPPSMSSRISIMIQAIQDQGDIENK